MVNQLYIAIGLDNYGNRATWIQVMKQNLERLKNITYSFSGIVYRRCGCPSFYTLYALNALLSDFLMRIINNLF